MLLRDNVYEALRTGILTCALLPGQDLREQDLAARHGVSRSPVRDALLRLEGEHLVTVLPRQGYRVNPVSVTDAADIFGFRLVIEPACAAAAAMASGEDRLDPFRSFGGADFIAYNRQFHATVAGLSGNGRMAAVARDLAQQSDRLVRVSLASIGTPDPDRLIAEHSAVIDAIQAGDAAGAGEAMRAHIAGAMDRVLTALRDQQADAA
jgi:DNA-binding GntR family transcriptional regulator